MTIKAIETQYKGYRFRSRLEARWAVFFEAMSKRATRMTWDYEPEGFDLGSLGFYLPDFKITYGVHEFYLEIKPSIPSETEIEKGKLIAEHTSMPFYFLTKIPDPTRLICGVPAFDALCFIPSNVRFKFSNDPHFTLFNWYADGLPSFLNSQGFKGVNRSNCFDIDNRYHIKKRGKPHPWHCEKGRLSKIGVEVPFFMRTKRAGYFENDIVFACKKARSARFEHGERPQA